MCPFVMSFACDTGAYKAYEECFAEAWLRRAAAQGRTVLVGEPGRNFAPTAGVAVLAEYDVPVSTDLESRTCRHTRVLRLEPTVSMDAAR